MNTRDRETRRRGGTGESGKLRWPTDRPRGETRRWTRWIQGGEGSRPRGSAAQVGPRIGRGETRRAHVWHTHRNRRADGRPSAEAVPWTTYLWWGETRRIFLLSLLHRPSSSSLSLRRRFLVPASASPRILRRDPARFLHRNSSRSLTLLSPWKTVKSDNPGITRFVRFSSLFPTLAKRLNINGRFFRRLKDNSS